MFAIGENQDFLMGKFLTGNHKSVCCELCTRFLAPARPFDTRNMNLIMSTAIILLLLLNYLL
jgi:hypothetical protein